MKETHKTEKPQGDAPHSLSDARVACTSFLRAEHPSRHGSQQGRTMGSAEEVKNKAR